MRIGGFTFPLGNRREFRAVFFWSGFYCHVRTGDTWRHFTARFKREPTTPTTKRRLVFYAVGWKVVAGRRGKSYGLKLGGEIVAGQRGAQ